MPALGLLALLGIGLALAGGKRKKKKGFSRRFDGPKKNKPKLYTKLRERYVRERNAKVQSYAGLTDEDMELLDEAGDGDIMLAQADLVADAVDSRGVRKLIHRLV